MRRLAAALFDNKHGGPDALRFFFRRPSNGLGCAAGLLVGLTRIPVASAWLRWLCFCGSTVLRFLRRTASTEGCKV